MYINEQNQFKIGRVTKKVGDVYEVWEYKMRNSGEQWGPLWKSNHLGERVAYRKPKGTFTRHIEYINMIYVCKVRCTMTPKKQLVVEGLAGRTDQKALRIKDWLENGRT